ncbi:MAG: aldehyde reductase [Bacteroidota bacterium]
MERKGKVLVTGITGFLASHIAVQLLDRGYSVVGSMRNLSRATSIGAVIQRHADTKYLSFVEANLLQSEAWNAAVEGVDFVIHVASPFPQTLPKHEDDLIIPAKQGVLNVLKAAKKAGVKRVVLTSSTGAVAYGNRRQGTFTEADWTNVDNKKDTSPYFRSKTIAEKAAWDFIDREGEGLELTTILPGAILGPVLEEDVGTSAIIVKKMLDGSIPAVPNIGFAMVDVRSVAELHILAMESPAAAGERFIGAGEFYRFKEVGKVLKDVYPKRRIPQTVLPNFAVRLFYYVDKTLGPILLDLGAERKIDNTKARTMLGWEPIPVRQAILDCARSMIDLEIV